MLVINSQGLVHDCDTQERYENFKKAGWKDYTPPVKKENTKKTVKK